MLVLRSFYLNISVISSSFNRNNLTVIELIGVQGQGGKGDLRLSNRKPGSTKPLSFEMSDKHMKLCESEFQARSDDDLLIL